MLNAPASDQVEVNVFGPGFGESIVLHIGNNKWIVIDSCIDSESKHPAALQYLERIGVDPGSAVRLLVATHWHDDHVRGLAAMAEACTQAHFCLSAALRNEEFLGVIAAYEQRNTIRAGAGGHEIIHALKIARSRGARVSWALENTILDQVQGAELSHGRSFELRAISPSGEQFSRGLRAISNLHPAHAETKRRLPDPRPNDLSIAISASFGTISLLLGADLEEHGDKRFGWSAVMELPGVPRGGLFFKIPHHGSKTGHHERTWGELLGADPVSVLTPWNRGSKLPTADDIDRICRQTPNAYSTSRTLNRVQRQRPKAVEKTIRQYGFKVRPLQFRTGHIRYRIQIASERPRPEVDTFSGACRLSDLRDNCESSKQSQIALLPPSDPEPSGSRASLPFIDWSTRSTSPAFSSDKLNREEVVDAHLVDRLVMLRGWRERKAEDYNRKLALDPEMLVEFLRATQPDEWARLEGQYPGRGRDELLRNLVNRLQAVGALEVLRKGITIIPGIPFRLCAFQPALGLNAELMQAYEANILSVTRQVRYSLKNENAIDVVLLVNGRCAASS